MPPLINICSLWVYRHSPWWHWSLVHRKLCWIEIGLKLVEKDGFEFSFLLHWSYQSTITEKLQNLHILIPSFMFVLRKPTFAMTALISCTSNTMIDLNWPWIGGERWFGIFVATALMISLQAFENFHIRMPPLISICSLSEYRHWPWRHWSREHQNLCWKEISLKMVEQDGLEFLLEQHWSCSSPQELKIYTSWWPIWSIYVCSETIDIRNDDTNLVWIEYSAI